MRITKKNHLRGEILIPGDKSISHRGVMLGALSRGTTRIRGFLPGADCLSTISCFRRMNIHIEQQGTEVLIQGQGLYGLTAPTNILDAGNSGTTLRLLSGILAAQPFSSTLTGDASLENRPMGRILTPLTRMGAHIISAKANDCAPLTITGRALRGIRYSSPVASAQVKSCILLAGLYADGPTSVTEPYISRNHSELMLQYFGAKLSTEDTTVTIQPKPALTARELTVPGDISSASYFIAAALLVPDSELLIHNVGINPTRDGILKVCQKMGANLTLSNFKMEAGEPTADLLIRSSSLTGTTIGGALIPTLIDELPVIAVLAAFAEGTTIIKDAGELKVKESNRIDTVVKNLKAMGADVTATKDGMIIRGGPTLHGASIDTHKDHRIAMAFAIAALAAEGETTILDADCASISYPNFYETLEQIAD